MKIKHLFVTLLLAVSTSAHADWFLRGTFNNWASTQMVPSGTNTVEVKNVVFESAGSMKFDRFGNWKENYGIGGLNGSNIAVAAGKWNIKFYTDTKNWNISRVVDFHLRGTHNSWAEGDLLTPLPGSTTNYEICRNFGAGTATSSPRFKIDPNGGWGTDSFPVQDYPASGWTKIVINGSTRSIVSVKTKLATNCSVEVTPVEQTLTFVKGTEPFTLFVDDTLNNPAVGLGTGAISYESTDSSVASVDKAGLVTINGEGLVTISAFIAADSKFKAATSSYTITSSLGNVSITGWIGANDTQVNFPAAAKGLEFLRDNSGICYLNNFISIFCNDLKKDFLSEATISDTALTLSQKGYYQLKKDAQASKLSISSNNMFFARWESPVVSFNNKLWLIGGSSRDAGNMNDVWSSTNGSVWKLETEHAAFSERSFHQLVVFNNKLWLIGGVSNRSEQNDIWSSVDGVNWVQEVTNAAFSARYKHKVIVFDNKLILVGGTTLASNEFKNDVWSSVDGITWVQQTAGAAFSGRDGFNLVSYNNQLWVVAGANHQQGDLNDVWSSTDGVTWVLRNANAEFSKRGDSQVIKFDNKLWLVGGNTFSGLQSDVWSSMDGVHWTQQAQSAAFSPRAIHSIVLHNNQLVLVGGISLIDDNIDFRNDVWVSGDVVNWIDQHAKGTANVFSDRSGHQVVVYKNKLWVIGGYDRDTLQAKNDVWSSFDGLSWKLEIANAAFTPREDHQVVVYKDRLLLIGGQETSLPGSKVKNDIWSSTDGVNWILEKNQAAFMPRSQHQVVVHNNKLWLIGGAVHDGENFSENGNDVWSSTDGVSWVQEIVHAAFSGRRLHEVKSFNNKLWLVGGIDGLLQNDVWSSTDGIHWLKQLPNFDFGASEGQKLIVGNEKLWLVCGACSSHEVLSSTDGENWVKQASNAPFPSHTQSQGVYFNNKLFIIGGYLLPTGQTINDVWSSSDGSEWRKGFKTTFQFQ